MLSALFSGRVFIHSPSHEKRAVIGIPSPKLQNTTRVNRSNNQIKTLNGVKVFTFYHLGTATSLFSMGDIDN